MLGKICLSRLLSQINHSTEKSTLRNKINFDLCPLFVQFNLCVFATFFDVFLSDCQITDKTPSAVVPWCQRSSLKYLK